MFAELERSEENQFAKTIGFLCRIFSFTRSSSANLIQSFRKQLLFPHPQVSANSYSYIRPRKFHREIYPAAVFPRQILRHQHSQHWKFSRAPQNPYSGASRSTIRHLSVPDNRQSSCHATPRTNFFTIAS